MLDSAAVVHLMVKSCAIATDDLQNGVPILVCLETDRLEEYCERRRMELKLRTTVTTTFLLSSVFSSTLFAIAPNKLSCTMAPSKSIVLESEDYDSMMNVLEGNPDRPNSPFYEPLFSEVKRE